LRKRRRHLPHYEQPGGVYFITFTLKPGIVADLSGAQIAPIIIGALRYFAGTRYHLYDYTVMPDHVHCIVQPIVRDGDCEPLDRIMHSLKSWTANEINRALGRTGALWLAESYDHMLRGEDDYKEKARYIFNNPVARRLVDDAVNWPWWGNGVDCDDED